MKPTGVPSDWLFQALERRGISRAMASREISYSAADLESSNGLLSLDSYFRLFDWAAEKLHEPLLGAQIAKESGPGDYGLLGYLMSHGATLRDKLSLLERYHDIFSTEFSFRVSIGTDTSWCTYSEAKVDGRRSPQDVVFSMSLVVNLIRPHAPDKWLPKSCCFKLPAPLNVEPYGQYFGNKLVFGSPVNRIGFESHLLDVPTSKADAGLLPILVNQANQLLAEVRIAESLAEKTRLLLLTSIGNERIDTTLAASRLNMSVRSLHRHLEKEGTSFKRIREEVLVHVAKEALRETNMSVSTIAAKLSYSETSAFDRLFKRLTGLTPRQYRRAASAQ